MALALGTSATDLRVGSSSISRMAKGSTAFWDADAADYVSRVQAADGEDLELGIVAAYHAFCLGCKDDGIWDAIQACCVIAGARTVAGALVPLKRPYGAEKFNPSASPAIVGATGSYSVSTKTMTNSASAEYPSYPRFNFDYSLTQNKRYRIDGVLSGDVASVYGVYLGGTVLSSSTANGVLSFSGIYTATDATTLLGVWLRGQLSFPASVTIESLSIREDSFTPTAYPQPVNFVSGDYSRSLGLQGDGSTKYIDTNRANDADGQDDRHLAVYMTGESVAGRVLAGSTDRSAPTSNIIYCSGGGNMNVSSQASGYLGISADFGSASGNTPAFLGASRNGSTGFSARGMSQSQTVAAVSQATYALNEYVFARNDTDGSLEHTDARLSFYSIGSAVSDLALLDARVSALMSQIAAALA